MNVIKRNGKVEAVNFEKIHKRINWLIKEPYVLKHVNGTQLTIDVIKGLIDNINTSDIDKHTAEVAASYGTTQREYLTLAGRIVINDHHKNTMNSFKDKVYQLYRNVRVTKFINFDKNVTEEGETESNPIVNTLFYKYVMIHQAEIDKYIDYSRDYLIDYFGFKTLETSYLLKSDDKIVERPQDVYMRNAIEVFMPIDPSEYRNEYYLRKIFHVYDMVSQQYYTHATPTLFNSGTYRNNLTSCFLLGTEDSLEGIMKTLTDSVKISKYSGGVGIHISNWRSSGSLIKGTNGKSSGAIPFLRLFNDGARAFDQGGKRKGSFAIYLEMHHPDLLKFIELKKLGGDENLRCRDLFLALWVSDLFMKRWEQHADWSLFDPNTCPGLNDVYGDEYEELYLSYEKRGLAKATINTVDIMKLVIEAQMEKGVPYILYKDTINRNSMQKNIGIIRSSNLCVTGDTNILTNRGYFPIKGLAESNPPVHIVWNGEVFTPATFAKTGENQEILEVEFTYGQAVKCTPYHKFIITRDNGKTERIVEARYLRIGDHLVHCKYPVLDNEHTMTTGIPINSGTENKLAYLGALLNKALNRDKSAMEICSLSKKYVSDVQLMCQTLGTNPAIISIEEQKIALSFVSPTRYRLVFSSSDVEHLYKLGLATVICRGSTFGNEPNCIKSINKLDTLEDTYCFNEPLKNRGIFNGVLLGNCTEITLYSDANEYACCNLASICLSKFVEDTYSDEELAMENKRELNHEFPKHPKFNYIKLAEVAGQLTENLNNVIDRTFNPVVETARSNFNHRPIGIGIQGLADVFMKFKFPFESDKAQAMNKKIAEAIYYGAISKSTELCRTYYQQLVKKLSTGSEVRVELYPKKVLEQYPELEKENLFNVFTSREDIPKTIGAYPSYDRNGGAPIKTQFHWELYGLTKDDLSGAFDWESTRAHINIYGVRNSTVTALMPTASTSQIMGNTPCFEPYITNLYKRPTLSGIFLVINKYLMNDLMNAGLWNDKMKNYLLDKEGSIQDLDGVPEHFKQLYKTVWDMKQKNLMKLAIGRQPFVDQSQSMNLYMRDHAENGASLMMYAWKNGLKTGSYYIRPTPAAEAQNFTTDINKSPFSVDSSKLKYTEITEDAADDEFCLLCSS